MGETLDGQWSTCQMTHLLEILTNVRIVAAELGGTITLVLLIAFGVYKAWEEFIGKLSKRNDS